jgi:hypothetical protein
VNVPASALGAFYLFLLCGAAGNRQFENILALLTFIFPRGSAYVETNWCPGRQSFNMGTTTLGAFYLFFLRRDAAGHGQLENISALLTYISFFRHQPCLPLLARPPSRAVFKDTGLNIFLASTGLIHQFRLPLRCLPPPMPQPDLNGESAMISGILQAGHSCGGFFIITSKGTSHS